MSGHNSEKWQIICQKSFDLHIISLSKKIQIQYMNKGMNRVTCKDRHAQTKTHTPNEEVERETTEVFLEEELFMGRKVST